jgi:hypothetical protein
VLPSWSSPVTSPARAGPVGSTRPGRDCGRLQHIGPEPGAARGESSRSRHGRSALSTASLRRRDARAVGRVAARVARRSHWPGCRRARARTGAGGRHGRAPHAVLPFWSRESGWRRGERSSPGRGETARLSDAANPVSGPSDFAAIAPAAAALRAAPSARRTLSGTRPVPVARPPGLRACRRSRYGPSGERRWPGVGLGPPAPERVPAGVALRVGGRVGLIVTAARQDSTLLIGPLRRVVAVVRIGEQLGCPASVAGHPAAPGQVQPADRSFRRCGGWILVLGIGSSLRLREPHGARAPTQPGAPGLGARPRRSPLRRARRPGSNHR